LGNYFRDAEDDHGRVGMPELGGTAEWQHPDLPQGQYPRGLS